MDIEIIEAGFDAPVVVNGTDGIALTTRHGGGYFQCYAGNGFTFWHNRYQFTADTTLQARANVPVLELHITRSGHWSGEWEGVDELALHPSQFNLTFTPHVLTRAWFQKNKAYRSCDIHFEFSYLQSLASDFPALDRLLQAVQQQQPSALAPRPHACTREMLSATDDILRNPFGLSVQQYILETKVRQILLAALEKVSDDLRKPPLVLRTSCQTALYHARHLIEAATDSPLTHQELSRQSGLNEWLLKKGFRQMFGCSPYQYHRQLKIEKAKELLLTSREPIDYIAYALGYSQASSFGHEFKKATGLTPAEFRKSKP